MGLCVLCCDEHVGKRQRPVDRSGGAAEPTPAKVQCPPKAQQQMPLPVEQGQAAQTPRPLLGQAAQGLPAGALAQAPAAAWEAGWGPPLPAGALVCSVPVIHRQQQQAEELRLRLEAGLAAIKGRPAARSDGS